MERIFQVERHPNRNVITSITPDGRRFRETIWKQRDNYSHDWWNCWRQPRGHPLCGLNLDRIHLTCLRCGIRRSYLGKMPDIIEVGQYQITMRWLRNPNKPRGHDLTWGTRIRLRLLKISLSLIETFLAKDWIWEEYLNARAIRLQRLQVPPSN